MSDVDDLIVLLNRAMKREVGYASATDPNRPRAAAPARWSKYAQNGWHGLWCARGISTTMMRTIGVAPTVAAIGKQPGMIAGWAATFMWIEWFRRNTIYPRGGISRATPGLVLMMRFGTADPKRVGNETDHVSWVHDRTRDRYVPAIGFNSVRPGTRGEPSMGATVSYQRRRIDSGWIVGAYRPDYEAAVKLLGGPGPSPAPPAPAPKPPAPKPPAPKPPAPKPPAQFKPHGRTTKQIQALVGVTPDGDYGPATHGAVKAHQALLTEYGYNLGAPDGLWGKSTHDAQEAYMSELTEIKAALARIEADTRLAKVHQDLATRVDALAVVPLSVKGRETLGTELTSLPLTKAVELLLRHAYQTGNLLPVVEADVKGIASGVQAVAGPNAANVEVIIREAADAALSKYQATFTRVTPEESA